MSEQPNPPGTSADETTAAPSTDANPRREFLKASAAVTGASLLGGCLTDTYDRTDLGVPGAAAFDRFEHVITVMFENRSIDNVLGYIYPSGQVPRNQFYNGIGDLAHSNAVPSYINDGHATVTTRVSPGTDADYSNPNPDPGEEYQHVNTQLFDVVNPASNAFLQAANMTAPFNAPAAGQPATMSGFVHDYCNNFVANVNRLPTFEEYRVIMDGFSPAQLPVLSTLAREFAIYDAWFCAVPTQTFTNRSFFHASSSSGAMVNTPYSKWLTNSAPTIFNRLEDARIPWKIYFDATQIISLTGLIHAPALLPFWRTRFATMDTFYSDVANGTLPAYAFVEPRMLFLHNDYHPPSATFVIDHVPIGATSDVRAGELLLHQIYSAFRASASGTGSNALNTMLLVTFDEHGGCFDHVAPPAAIPPYNPQPGGEFGFLFDRLGVRVAAIVVSAHTQANTVINRPINHAALIRTLCGKFDLPHLTERDRTAPDLSDAYNLDTVRDPSTWPVTVPQPLPPAQLQQQQQPDPLAAAVAPLPLNDLERHILGLAMTYFQGREPAQSEIPTTIGVGYTTLKSIATGAFGPA